MERRYQVRGMSCSACVAAVEKSVKKLQGVKAVNVSLLTNSMTVEFENQPDDQLVIKAVKGAGYAAKPFKEEKGETVEKPNPAADELKGAKARLWLSVVFTVPLLYIAMGHMFSLPIPHFFHGTANAMNFALVQFLLVLPVVYLNRSYFLKGFKTLFKGSPNMDSLIAVGSSAALLYGVFALFKIGSGLGHGNYEIVDKYIMELYFESAAAILTLITLGKFLEARAKNRTSYAISKLMDLAPQTATVLRDGIEQEIPAHEVAVGDIVLIRPGQRVPVDGVILEGASAVDESALTGESIPSDKAPGNKVMTASINLSGFLKIKAEKVGADTTLSQIIKLVEEAASSKAPISRLADKISGIFVPVVISIATVATIVWLIAGYGIEFALSIGISVLVISCPCALGLATPVAIMVGTGRGAALGILIKSAESLETAHLVKTVLLDKTGTITEGKPQVTDIIAENGNERHLLEMAASIESLSEHPLAKAILQKAQSADITPKPIENFTTIPGRGILGYINTTPLYAGNAAFMQDKGIDISLINDKAETLAAQGKTPLFFALDKQLLGLIAVADVIKPTSKEAIEELKRLKIKPIMLTGDNERTAKAIAQQLDIEYIAQILPQDKEAQVRKFQSMGEKVAMIGDGINDAPALARADVGIAIGAGTDIAMESADIVLMKNDLKDAVAAIRLSIATIRNIKQNLFWAFFYNTLGIPLAAGVFYTMLNLKLNPIFAAAAMSFSSIFVVTNALRLKSFKPYKRKAVKQ